MMKMMGGEVGAVVVAVVLLMIVAAGGGATAGEAQPGTEPENWVVGGGGEDWLASTEFDKTYVRYDQVELLNGYNPANEYYVQSGGWSGVLDARDKKISARFTAQNSKTATHIEIWPRFLKGEPFEIRTGLQVDAGGNPSGKWLGSATFIRIPHVSSWRLRAMKEPPKERYATTYAVRVKLDMPVRIEKGKVYHVVSQYESGKIDKDNLIHFEGVNPQQSAVARSYHGDSNVNFHDPALKTLQFDGKKWSNPAEKQIPLFILVYSDGTAEGNCGAHWRMDLAGKYCAAQVLRVENADKEVTQLGMPLRGGGNLQDDLHYEIEDPNGEVLRRGILARREELSGGFVWYYNDFEPLLLKKEQVYRIVVKTPDNVRGQAAIATDPGGMQVGALKRDDPLYAAVTYGGADSMAMRSYDGGKTWHKHPSQDLAFKFKLKETDSGSITSRPTDSEPVSGAGAKWDALKLEGKIPEGTGIDIFVSSSEDNAAWSDFVTVQKGAESGRSYTLPAEHQKRYMKWRAVLKTNDVTISPKVTRVVAAASRKRNLTSR